MGLAPAPRAPGSVALRRAGTPQLLYMFWSHCTADWCPGDAVSRGPMESIRTWASRAICDFSVIPSSQIRLMTGSSVGNCWADER